MVAVLCHPGMKKSGMWGSKAMSQGSKNIEHYAVVLMCCCAVVVVDVVVVNVHKKQHCMRVLTVTNLRASSHRSMPSSMAMHSSTMP